MSNNDRYSQQRNSKIPVTARQFAWLQDDDKGEVMLHVGPTMVAPRAAERLVVDDGQGQYISSPLSEPQRMIELNEMQYAVLFNPLADQRAEEGPNGNFRDGRNAPRPLLFGQRRMIPGPSSFHLWPGQRVEVRDAYELSSNQYLVVKVYGDIDTASPWFDITLRSASITTATTEPLSSLNPTTDDNTPADLSRGQIIVIRGLDTHFYIPPSGVEVVPDLTLGDDGQLISTQQAQKLLAKATPKPSPPQMKPPEPPIAQGLSAPIGLGAASAGFMSKGGEGGPSLLERLSSPSVEATYGDSPYEEANAAFSFDDNDGEDLYLNEDEVDEEDAPSPPPKRSKLSIKDESPRRDSRTESYEKKRAKAPPRREPSSPPAPPPPPAHFATPSAPPPNFGPPPGFGPPPMPSAAPAPLRAPEAIQAASKPSPRPAAPSVSEQQLAALSDKDIQNLTGSDLHRQALERQARMGRLVRQAVMLGEKDFCILIDADGRRQIKVGPARIFPGPYDRFLTVGSRGRIYSAYELLPQRALWLRFVSEVSAARLSRLLPQNIKLTQESYLPGDDLIVTGVNTFFFPFDEVEVLNPTTGQPHVGNDHDAVFIHAIGIDQRSGIYVQDLASGEVRTIKGQRTHLVDPRRERRISRSVSARDWNLWIGSTQPTRQTSTPVTTPWAIAVNVPNNAACMAISSTARRVIEGPCITLLAFDERLAVLHTSGDDPETHGDEDLTCFLPIQGDSLAVEVSVQSQDLIALTLELHLRLDFDPALSARWFDVEYPARHLYDFIQRTARRTCAQHLAFDLWPRAQEVLRAAFAPPHTLPDNGMRLLNVEVIQLSFVDPQISEQLQGSRRDLVSRDLSDALDRRRLEAEQHSHLIQHTRLLLQQSHAQALAELDAFSRRLQAQADQEALQLNHVERTAEQDAQAKIDALRQATSLHLKALEHATLDALQRQRDATISDLQALENAEANSHHQALQQLNLALLQASADAAVAAASAIHPALIDALSGLGDRILLADFAHHLSLTNLLSPDLLSSLHQILEQAPQRPPQD
jgi:hypothetical protein